MRGEITYIIYGMFLWMISLIFTIDTLAKGKTLTIYPGQQKHEISATFQHRLDSLEKEDDLTSWLDTWYVYLSDNPSAHYHQLTIPLKNVWRKPKTTSEQISWFYLLILGGYYELQQGNILKSTDLYEKAYQFVQTTAAVKDDEILEYLIKPLGNNYTRLGDYERAFYIQKEGLRRAKEKGNTMQEAAMLANISTTSRWNDHLQQALAFTREGLQKVKSGTPLQGLLYSTQADILQDVGQWTKAGDVIEKGLNVLLKNTFEAGTNNTYWYAGALMTAGTIEQKKHHLKQAEAYFRHAAHIYQKYFPRSRHREKMKLRVALGQVSLSKKAYSDALLYFNQALTGLLPSFEGWWPADTLLYSENTLLDALKGKAETLHHLGKDRAALKGYQKTAVVLQRLRKTIFSREARRLLQRQSLQTTEDGIRLAYHLFKKTGKSKYGIIALQMAEEHKSRLLYDDLQRNIAYSKMDQKDSLFIRQKRLKQALSFYMHAYVKATLRHQKKDSARWKQRINTGAYQLSIINQKMKNRYPTLSWNSTIDVKEMLHHLSDTTAVWEYFTGPDQWFAFSLTHEGLRQFSLLGSADSLNSEVIGFISRWFKLGSEAMINAPKKYTQQAFKVYKKLGLTLPGEASRLLIVPDGTLGKLPFDALITDDKYRLNPGKWPYLLWKAKTSQSYSLAVWNQLQYHFSKNEYQDGFSGFFISPDENSALATLQGVKGEEQNIRKHIRGAFYKNEKATSKKLVDAVEKDEVIHISTHSFLLGKKQIPTLQMEDKKLMLSDLYPLHVHPSLVVMSACQTADGLLSPGEGIISLARAFTAIGAGGVIAALWSINDETAATLTALYYKELQKSGDKAGALYQTKSIWLTDEHRKAVLKLPYYWAGMVYYGNDIPLSQPLQTPVTWPDWGWYVLAGIFLLIGLFWWRRKH